MLDAGLAVTLVLVAGAYAAIAFGRLPGLRLDRAGATLLAAILLVVTGRITLDAAWASVGVGTLALLFGLMVLSGSFVLSGFYARVATALGGLRASPLVLLAVFVLASGALSAIFNHDVVVAMTPILVQVTLARGLNPVPFVLAFCFASNTAASGSLIGSPSNMILADRLDLSFRSFLGFAGLPALASLPIVWAVVAVLYRGRWTIARPGASPAATPIVFDRAATLKSALITALVLLGFFATDTPPRVIALAAAAGVLVSRRYPSATLLKQADGSLLLLIFGLFIVNAAFEATGLPAQAVGALRGAGLDLLDPVTLLLVVALLSDLIGNNATVMLLLPHTAGMAPNVAGAVLALGTGFSGSAVVFGSLAGIVATEQASRHGITISFGEFSRAGLPVAVACLALAVIWVIWYT